MTADVLSSGGGGQCSGYGETIRLHNYEIKCCQIFVLFLISAWFVKYTDLFN